MTEAGWTREKPSKEGVYWFRWTENSNPLILSVAKDDCAWRVLEMGNQYDGALAGYSDGEWLGPITPDSYQQGRVAGLRDAEVIAQFMVMATPSNVVAALRFMADKLEAQQAHGEKGVGG